MIYHEEKRSRIGFPIVVILIAMAAIVGSLALSSGPRAPARVWVPQSSTGHLSHRGGVNALSVDAMTGALPVNHRGTLVARP
ncbi:hypothetical protein EFD56_21480 [Rhizobium phaseoli]|nr:hypothetical protein EFD56_21480 [Rhizobium phaseoli]